MLHETGQLPGARGVQLTFEDWRPDGPPRGVIVLVHGYAEHIGRYKHVIGMLTARDYAVFTQDHRGHGRSGGERANVERFALYVEDLRPLVRRAREAAPDVLLFMYGHSMGGLIATHYTLDYPGDLDGLILTSAAIQIGDDVSPLVKRLSGVVARVTPGLTLVKGAEGVLSRDPSIEAATRVDPLCYNGGVKARMGNELLTASLAAQARMGELRLPLLVMHGTADRYTNPQGSRRLYEAAASPDKTLKLWPDNYHELHNDLDRADVMATLLAWLDTHTATTDHRPPTTNLTGDAVV